MDIFEMYSKEIHKDIKPAETPTDEELFELEGEKSQVDINKDTTDGANVGVDVEALTKQIEDLSALVNKLVSEKGEVNE